MVIGGTNLVLGLLKLYMMYAGHILTANISIRTSLAVFESVSCGCSTIELINPDPGSLEDSLGILGLGSAWACG